MKIQNTGYLGASICALLLSSGTARAAEATAFREDFETDGLNTRYTVENASDDGANDFFARRAHLSNGTRTTYGTLSGNWFWAARDIDGHGTGAVNGMDADEARITFSSFSIHGIGNFSLMLEAAQGQDELEFDNTFLIQVKVDGGDWVTIGGFRGTGTNSPGRYFVGNEDTIASLSSPRMTNNFATFSWPLSVVGDSMQIRIKENLNGGDEEYAFDNIRLVGDNSLGVARMSLPSKTFNEGDSTTLTLTLDNPAPAGGVTLALVSSDTTEVSLPATVAFAEGETTKDVPVQIVADHGFDGDQTVNITLNSPGFARNEIAVKVVNVDAKPNIVLNEFLTSIPGTMEEDLEGDANNDGVRNGSQDEFLEFVNNDSIDIDMSGWTISDDKGVRHVFPAGTILKSGRAIVIFAGGNPTGLFGGAIVQKATAGNFGYGDTGDVIVLASGGADVISYDYTATFPSVYQSVTRSPDVTGSYVLYNTVAAHGELFSPGTKINGEPFGTFSNTLHLTLGKTTVAENDTTAVVATVTLANPAPAGGLFVSVNTNGMTEGASGLVPDEIDIPSLTLTVPAGATSATFPIYAHNDGILDGDRTVSVVVRADDAVPAMASLTVTEVLANPYNVVINEVMPSLAGTDLDLNGNGTSEEAINDQFIEIVNNSGRTVDMSGWRLYSFARNDTNGEVCVHIFPKSTKLAYKGSIVIFGGGNEADMQAAAATLAGGATIQVSNSGGVGVNLTTSDDGVIRLVNQFGYVLDEETYESAMANQGQSITRNPDVTGAFGSLHLPLSGMNFLAVSPGAKVNGTAFAGNGLIQKTAYETIFSDYYLYTEDYYYSDVFGWTYVTAWPWLYSFEMGGWAYVSAEASTAGNVFFYNYLDGAWYYTAPGLYPWGWNMVISDWSLVY
jgi:hypothetical protein